MTTPPDPEISTAAQHPDVRMRGFRDRVSVRVALDRAVHDLTLRMERVDVTLAAGRVLAQDVASAVDVPSFRRSAMDGYAVVAADTFGASLYDPIRLTLRGESMPGGSGGTAVEPGFACRVMTGAPVPEGADAVLKAESARESDGFVDVQGAVPPGKNVGRIGEDVRAGDALLAMGRRLRPQDAALLASVGVGSVPVFARPRVRIIATGNELVAPGELPSEHQIVDSNSVLLTALVERDGGVLEQLLRLPDDRATIEAALRAPGADVILTIGGTSVGREDYVPLLVQELGTLDVHGVSMRPSSPTGLGRIGDARIALLPGNPVSCLAAYDFFAGPVVRILGGGSPHWPYVQVRRRLTSRLVSEIGRTDYARMATDGEDVAPIAVSGASVLSSTTRAVGFTIIPSGSEGADAGELVDVYLYDAQTSQIVA